MHFLVGVSDNLVFDTAEIMRRLDLDHGNATLTGTIGGSGLRSCNLRSDARETSLDLTDNWD